MVRPEDGQGLDPVHKNDHKKDHTKNHPADIPTVPLGMVQFVPDSGPSLSVLLDETTPVLTSGYSKWEIVDRPLRTGMTRFAGKDPFKQDIAILFDGWMFDEPQESNISVLMRMSQQPNPMIEPTKITLRGQALHKDLIWVIEGIDWGTDKVIWRNSGNTPVRMRQPAVVHMLQYIEGSVIVTNAIPVVKELGSGKKVKIRGYGGMTLQEISQEQYGTPAGWSRILMANPWLAGTTKRQKIPAGSLVQIPYWNGHGPKTITTH